MNKIYLNNDSTEVSKKEMKQIILETTLEWREENITPEQKEIADQIIESVE